MKLTNIWLFRVTMVVMALAITLKAASSTTTVIDHKEVTNTDTSDHDHLNVKLPLLHALHGDQSRKFMAENYYKKRPVTCDQVPQVCQVKGSMGPDCCKKKCVNTLSDGYNCGWCGKKCKYSEICCDGKCVNPRVDNYHCGKCNHICNKGSSCAYGICSYAY